jgi:hypothetical protein
MRLTKIIGGHPDFASLPRCTAVNLRKIGQRDLSMFAFLAVPYRPWAVRMVRKPHPFLRKRQLIQIATPPH